MNAKQPTIDARISAALGDSCAVADDDLLRDVEWAIEQAARIAEEERNLSLAPATSPGDAEQAHQRASVAELRRDRLKAALPRIQQKIAAAERSAAIEKFSGDADEVEARATAAAKKVAATYSKCASEIVAVLLEAEATNKEVERVNHAAPDGVHRRVDKVSLSHLRDLVLPDPEHRGNLWPPRQIFSLYSGEPAMDERDRADMVRARQRALADAVESDRQRPQRTAERFEQMTRDQEAHQNREARELFEQSQRR